jgi:hypothetical protein
MLSEPNPEVSTRQANGYHYWHLNAVLFGDGK